MRASNPETIYSAGSGDWTQGRLITVSGSTRTAANEPQSYRQVNFILRELKVESLGYISTAADSMEL